MKAILLAAVLALGGVVLLAPEAAAHECFENGIPDVDPSACVPHWYCVYYPEEGYIVCYHP